MHVQGREEDKVDEQIMESLRDGSEKVGRRLKSILKGKEGVFEEDGKGKCGMFDDKRRGKEPIVLDPIQEVEEQDVLKILMLFHGLKQNVLSNL